MSEVGRIVATRDGNARYWSSRRVTAEYARQSGLTRAERRFLDSVGELRCRRVLDVGVGGGRTAGEIGPLAAGYLGIDYAPPLIRACRRRFAGTPLAGCFEVADARRLDVIPDAGFDVVLFVANGLDYVGDADRRAALSELARVCRPGGPAAVTSHNLNHVGRVLSLRHKVRRLRAERTAARLPFALARHLPRRLVSVLRNPPARTLLRRRWAYLVDDGAPLRGTRTYYVAPDEMARQLDEAGFEIVDVVAPDGRSVAERYRGAVTDPWLLWSLRRKAR